MTAAQSNSDALPTLAPITSLNLVADSMLSDRDSAVPVAGLPTLQRNSPVMVEAHQVVDSFMDDHVDGLSLVELHALKTRIRQREKHLLETHTTTELYAPIDQTSLQFDNNTTNATPDAKPELGESPVPAQSGKVTILEYAQLREEAVNLEEVVSTRVTADLVKTLRNRDRELRLPGRRRGRTPLAAATAFVGSALKLTTASIDRRVTAATAMWPAQNYRRTKVSVPTLAKSLEQGDLSLTTAMIAHDQLSKIRQSVRRAGGDDTVADELVAHREAVYVPHAQTNNSYVFARFAKADSDSIRHELIGPRQTLTNDQVKHEKGMFYHKPIGDKLHCLQLVVDDAELLHLEALREFSTKLQSSVSKLRALSHQTVSHTDETADLTAGHDHAGDDVPNNPRLTPDDIDLGIAQLFDGQTKAERWLNTLMDFLSGGLILHKVYEPHASEKERTRRMTALSRAAEHSEVLADILAMDDVQDVGPPDVSSRSQSNLDPLEKFIPPGYQLLRPNLNLIVEITLRDLVGASPTLDPVAIPSDRSTTELRKVITYLQDQTGEHLTPKGTPGSIDFDVGLARQQACAQKIIPMVLGSGTEPLDVGRAQRSAPTAIRRALHVRDRGCVVPGCPIAAEWCIPHHLEEWSQGGHTSLKNTALVCRQHHNAVHDNLILIQMEPDGRPSCSLPKTIAPSGNRYRNTYWIR